MSWCDKLASTPTVAFRFTPHIVPSPVALQCLSPILDKLIGADAPQFTVEKNDPFSLVVNTEPGFRYSIDHTKLSVQFNHRVRYKNVSGGSPTMEMLSSPRPFTTLLPEVCDKLLDFVELTPNILTRKIHEISVMARTEVDYDDLPPGIKSLIGYTSRPWPGKVRHYLYSVLTEIADEQHWSERCHFTIARAEDQEKLMSANFEWQRVFKLSASTTRLSMKTIVDEAMPGVLRYLEDIAIGNIFDEEMADGRKPS